MRLEDIQLRDAARRGDAQACLAMAERLFCGRGFARNYTLGLAYLQQELNKKSNAAILLLGNLVPLNVLLAKQLQSFLPDAVDLGSTMAMAKLGALLLLRAESSEEARSLIAKAKICDGTIECPHTSDSSSISRFLKALPPQVVDVPELALWGARTALKEQNVERACYFIALATEFMSRNRQLADLVSSTVQLASNSGATLNLPVDLVEDSLHACSDSGEVEAQYGLGCALAGIPYGHLTPQRIVRSRNFDKATTLLLRAADAGKCQAWLTLSEMIPSSRSAISSRGIARFFLEKAALAGVLEAQTKLGAALLREAISIERAEEGVTWLNTAADRSCVTARELLQTLVLPIAELPLDYQKSTLQRITAIDPEMGMRVSLARSLHLTRREAMNFNAKRDIKPWGLFIPGACYENPKGRLAPAISGEMKSELQRTSEFFAAASSVENTLLVQRSRAQRHIFKLLSISESLFFASEIGRSLSHYGYGRHWACRSSSILEKLKDKSSHWTDLHNKHMSSLRANVLS
jgi:TPR repeat protein